MTTDKLTMLIPFMGFYESWHDSNFDSALESHCENAAESPELETLEIDSSAISELFWRYDLTSWGDSRREYCRDYVSKLRAKLEQELNCTVPIEYESMSSPKEYNFTTDRLFVDIPATFARTMRKEVDESILQSVIRDRHSSRSGFISFYKTDFSAWLKPVKTWDHNELQTLFEAWLITKAQDIEEIERDLACYDLSESAYCAFDSATDWAKYEEKLEELKAQKREELGISESDIPYRCPLTLDLFNSATGKGL